MVIQVNIHFCCMILWRSSYKDSSISPEFKAWRGDVSFRKLSPQPNSIFLYSLRYCLLWYLSKLISIHTIKTCEKPGKDYLMLLFCCFLFSSWSQNNVKFVWDAAVQFCGLIISYQCTAWLPVPLKGDRLDLDHFLGLYLKFWWAFQVTPKRWNTFLLFHIRAKFSRHLKSIL